MKKIINFIKRLFPYSWTKYELRINEAVKIDGVKVKCISRLRYQEKTKNYFGYCKACYFNGGSRCNGDYICTNRLDKASTIFVTKQTYKNLLNEKSNI